MYKNVGTTHIAAVRGSRRSNGAPYTERFQPVDAVRQNSVRAVDWNNDGKPDLIAPDTDGWVWYFRNTANRLFPVLPRARSFWRVDNRCASTARIACITRKTPTSLTSVVPQAMPGLISATGTTDGKKDLLVADGRGWLFLYLNEGTSTKPVLGPGTRVMANGKPIDGHLPRQRAGVRLG